LLKEQRDAADQLFRLKFQLKMGQTTGVKKLRELRKDVARIKTVSRERELGILNTDVANATTGAPAAASSQKATPAAALPVKKTAAAKPVASKAKKAVAKKQSSAAPKKKAAAKKKSKAKK